MYNKQHCKLGLGTYSLTGEDGTDAITAAIDAGYQHLDTARLYGNEDEVGDAIDAASVAREELFVATKIAHFEEENTSPEYVAAGITKSRDRLGVDTIDLLYHHWRRRPSDIDDVIPALANLRGESVADRIGVSNYRIEDVERALDLVDDSLYAN